MLKKDILTQQIINKKYNEYNIKLITQIDLIKFQFNQIIHLIFINQILI